MTRINERNHFCSKGLHSFLPHFQKGHPFSVLFKIYLHCVWVLNISVSEKQSNKWHNSYSELPCWVWVSSSTRELLLPEHQDEAK